MGSATVRRLGELEAVIMDVLWSHERAMTVRDVLTALSREPTPAYTTVMTVMDNLHRKTLLRRERAGRAYKYRPSHTRSEYDAQAMAEVLDASTDRAATLLKFIDRISPEELDRLRKLMASASNDAEPR